MSDDEARHADRPVMTRPSALANWGWFILKNLLGWVLIVASFPLGAFIPGPGGIPLFLLGFGLITFPGKRRLVAGMLRGRPIPGDSRAFRIAVVVVAVLLPVAVLLYAMHRGWVERGVVRESPLIIGATCVGAAMVLVYAGLHSLPLVNKIISYFPRIRRRIRPWMRRHGIDLLPPRRRKRRKLVGGHAHELETDPEIIEIHERHLHRLRTAWIKSKPWLKRLAAVAITAALLYFIAKPIVREWDTIRNRIGAMHWGRFLLASAMFAVFLLAFRALVWRRILKRFGHRLPVAPAVRIWSTSELARYLPGVIWQVVGRVYLVKPYGVRGSHCSASQVLELAIFLLANLLVAIACLVWLGIKQLDGGAAERWLYVAMGLVPVLVLLLHPRVLYRVMNGILRTLGKPVIAPRMGFASLSGLLLWSIVGLLWQSLAIWLLVSEPLGGLQLAKWWAVAGAYCLAWCAGFLAFWAPGGIGVRELVFYAALSVALPYAVRQRFADEPQQLVGVLMFLSVLLRLWATAGELMLAGVAYAFDWKGAMRGGGRNVEPLCEDPVNLDAATAPRSAAASRPAPPAPASPGLDTPSQSKAPIAR